MAEITATDILVYNGSAWVSVKTNKVMIHNGAEFINANSPKILHCVNDNYYRVGDAPIFEIPYTLIILRSSELNYVRRTISYTANNDGYAVVKSLPNNLTCEINTTQKTITIGYRDWIKNQTQNIVISCSNGAPDITITVISSDFGEVDLY